MSNAAPHATPDARTLLTSLLELIGQTHRVQDITPERLHAATGLNVETWGASRYGFRGDLTPHWGYLADVDGASMHGPLMDFSFVPTEPGGHPDASEICAFDFDAVDKALRSGGFDAQPKYGEHGAVLGHQYRRDQLNVEVLIQGETDAKAAHKCVTSVVLR